MCQTGKETYGSSPADLGTDAVIGCLQRYGLAMWRKSVIRLTVTEAKLIIKCSLFILLPGVFRLLGLKLNSEQKAGYIFVAPPYSQTACW